MAKNSADFTWTYSDGFFAIYPETAVAAQIVSTLIERVGSNKLLSLEFSAFCWSAVDAGYVIRKATQVKLNDDDLLAELGN